MTGREPHGPAPDQPVWDVLPHPLRARLAEIAASAVRGLPPADLPATLRPLSRFTPRKLARVGGGPLLAELAGSPGFRAAALAWWLDHRADGRSHEGPGEGTDPLAAAAEAVLAGSTEAAALVARLAERADTATLRAERDAARARADKLAAELERLRAELADTRDGGRGRDTEQDQESRRMRAKLSEQGERLRRARDEAEALRGELSELRRAAAVRVSEAEAARDRERTRAGQMQTRAARASVAAGQAQDAAGRVRQADQARLELLVETLSGAVTGLRRELALGGGGPRPADLVTGAGDRSADVGAVSDSAGLERLLGLPAVHLIVDGYNVSKTGYPDLALFDQRARLVGQLGVLAARTGAEVTCVFDGASVLAAPDRRPRGVRVLFSDPGVAADDVIRALVVAEPAGRPVVVVSSDRAVADGVRRDGARPVPSSVLLERLARG
ncbi:MAG: NYN domain-containing protein [Pseudonocardia sp.]